MFNSAFDPRDLAAINAAGSPSLSSTNFTGGVQAGYNYQIGNGVLGIEADFDSFSSHESKVVTAPFTFTDPTVNYQVSTSVKTHWLSTVRGRAGWLAMPNLLLYATGGLAIANIEVANAYQDFFPVQPGSGASSHKETNAGWTVGGGAEYAISRNWSVKGE